MAELLSFADALAAIRGRVEPLAAEPVDLAAAAGRWLAEPARALVDLPPFASSAMDGYALRAADAPGSLPVVFRIAAGRPAPGPLGAGQAMGIATGGVVPEGADAVVPHEDVTEQDDVLRIDRELAAGANVRPRGGDVAAGELVVAAGVRLRPGTIGALAATGVGRVSCARRPRVAVLTTGTELREPGESLAPGEIYESNGAMLRAQLAGDGAEVTLLRSVEDDEGAHRDALAAALEYDVVVTSGGVSVGPHDLVRRIEAELGVDEVFWRVAIRPGKPVSFGVRGSTLVFGLPGNPVSSLVCCELFVRPALRALQGEQSPGPYFETGRLAAPLRRGPQRDDFARALLSVGDGLPLLQPITGQESHMIVRSAAADAIVHVPRGEGELPAGAEARYLRLTV